MGSLFLFISLAVLVGIVGLLAYYFKSRLADIENKNMKSLEIIEGLYSQQQQMKQFILGGGGYAHQATLQQPQPLNQDNSQYDERIKIVLNDDSDEDIDDSDDSDEDTDDSDEDTDDSDEYDEDDEEEKRVDEVKKITVDMSFPEECELNIEEDEPEYIPEDEPEVHIDEEPIKTEEIVVNKLDEDKPDDGDNDFEITAVKSNDKDNYKKMSITALKNILHSRGIVTDSARLNKMKKSEIIDLLLVASLAQ
jgi:hypothetical protein